MPRQLVPGVNDLATRYPQVADQFAGDPSTVVAETQKTYLWTCPNHVEPFPQRLSHLLSGIGCGYCSGAKLLPGFNDMATRYPQLAEQVVGVDPTTVTAGTGQSFLWRCPRHDAPFRQTIGSRLRGEGCGICRGRQVVAGVNDLATTHPDLAAQLLDVDPTTVYGGGVKVYRWRCPNHEEPFEQSMGSRIRGYGCGICAGKQVLAGYNDLATTHPHLAAELVGTDPTTVRATTVTMLLWRCPNHEEPFPMTGFNRVKGLNCSYCRGLRVKAGVNDMATTHPQLAAELVGDPTTVLAGTNRTLLWRCPNHQEPFPSSGVARVNGAGCGYCDGKRLLVGFNDLATRRPDLAAELVGDPTSVISGTRKVLTWRCSLGHEYEMNADARVSAGRGCPYCANSKALAGFNDLATKFPAIGRELRDVDPATVLFGTTKVMWWRCAKCGGEWRASVVNRTDKKSGCPSCSRSNFDPTKPAIIYLMERHGEQQFGISGKVERRMYQHKRAGWTLVEMSPWMPGHQAADLELAVKRWLKVEVGTAKGTSEVWGTGDLEVVSLRDLFERAGVPWPFR